MQRLPVLLALGLAACGGVIDEPPVEPPAGPPATPPQDPPPGTPPPVVRPVAVEDVTLEVQTHTLPAALQSDATLQLGVLPSGVTVAGGAGGLFEVGASGFTAISELAVHGIAPHELHLVIATSDGLRVFDGEMVPSPLDGVLATERPQSLASRDEELWIGTSGGLWIHHQGRLSRFEGMSMVDEISTFDGASTVLVHEAGEHQAVRLEEGRWSAQNLSEELAITESALGPGGRIFGLKDGALLERVSLSGKAAWRSVALSTAENATVARDIQGLASDPGSGALWIVAPDAIYRLDTAGGRLAKIARPAGLGPVIAARAVAGGALWVTDGSTLHRIGNAGPPVSWAESIDRFAESNCVRCHASTGGIALPSLDTHEAWVANIDRILAALTAGRMPADQQPLRDGTIDLVRKWRDDGLRP